MWTIYVVPGTDDDAPPEEVHVYPLFGAEHVVPGMGCWCHPSRDSDFETVIVHSQAH